jgi:hypothetical protein
MKRTIDSRLLFAVLGVASCNSSGNNSDSAHLDGPEIGRDAISDLNARTDAAADTSVDNRSFDVAAGTATLTIGPSGGVLSLGQNTVSVPAGALATALEITITETAVPVPSGFVGYSPVYRFEPAGLVFAQPVTIGLVFSGTGSRAAMFWSKAIGTGYDNIGGTVYGGVLTATVAHFSTGFVGTDQTPDNDGGGADVGVGGPDSAADVAARDIAGDGQPDVPPPTDGSTAEVSPPSTCTPSNFGWALPDGGVDLDSDPGNCGSCGNRCSAGTDGVCILGICGLQASIGFSGMTQDSSQIYWSDRSGVYKASKPDLSGKTLLASGSAIGIAVDSTSVYWLDSDNNFNRMGLAGVADGGGATLVYAIPGLFGGSSTASAIDLTSDGTDAFVSMYTGGLGCPIIRFPLSGVPVGGSPVLIDGQGFENAHQHVVPAFDAGFVYWQGSGVYRAPKAGGTVSLLSNDTGGDSAVYGLAAGMVAVSGGNVYWVAHDGLMTTPVDSQDGGATVQLSSQGGFSMGVATDGSHIYWTTSDASGVKVMKMPLAGGQEVVLAQTVQDPLSLGGPGSMGTSVLVDDANVYWIGAAHNYVAIFRTPK